VQQASSERARQERPIVTAFPWPATTEKAALVMSEGTGRGYLI
jgi:hypothetical protein